MDSNTNTGLSTEALKKLVPAAFAENPSSRVSNKYTFVPTFSIVEGLKKEGWYPVRAKQNKARSDERLYANFHAITFRTESFLTADVKDIVPEFILSTSHLGQHSHKGYAALQRVVCANGAVIIEKMFEAIRLTHMRWTQEEISEMTYEYAKTFPNVLDRIKVYKSVTLSASQKITFAKQAMEVKFHNQKVNNPFEASQLLEVRREEDQKEDLWTVFNVIQENIIKGGISVPASDVRRKTKTKSIENIQREIQINKALWMLMASFATRS